MSTAHIGIQNNRVKGTPHLLKIGKLFLISNALAAPTENCKNYEEMESCF